MVRVCVLRHTAAMVPNEREARADIDRLLTLAGWSVQDLKAANIHASRGVAIREFPLKPGHGRADYLLYLDGRAAGAIEAKRAGSTLTGVEFQSNKYTEGLPGELPAWTRPLPFAYESTGVETPRCGRERRRSTSEMDLNGAAATDD